MISSITQERPDSADAVALISELEAHLNPLCPAESRHGFSIERLIAEQVAFFVLRVDGAPAGCGGIKLFSTDYGEVKRMYVRPEFRGRGLSKLMLNHLIDYADAHGVTCVRLETGMYQTEAIWLYERMGFRRVPPFGAYRSIRSACFTRSAYWMRCVV
jgi:GNAT superfamily N-acetyltransferase